MLLIFVTCIVKKEVVLLEKYHQHSCKEEAKTFVKEVFCILVFVSLFFFNECLAQSLEGVVYDSSTNCPLSDVHVFLAGTQNGTVSNTQGKFLLNISNSSTIPLVLTKVGYGTIKTTKYSLIEPMLIKMSPQSYLLEQVAIESTDSLSRTTKWSMFTEAFLHNSPNCKITNPDSIYLYYDKEEHCLYAHVRAPIIIENHALNYNIEYKLVEFTRCGDQYDFRGYCFFKPTEAIIKKRVGRRRKAAYLGSRTHLIRALYQGNTREEGFTLYNNEGDELVAQEIVTREGGKRKVCCDSKITVNYQKGGRSEISYMLIKPSCAVIERNGYFNSGAIMWLGKMTTESIGDLLPLDYFPE